MNMDVIMVDDGCRGVRRVLRGVLGWGNDQKGYLGVRMCADTYVVCFVCVKREFNHLYVKTQLK